MKYRIAMWAAAGFLVASGWAIYSAVAKEPMVSTLVRLTWPITTVGLRYPVSIYAALAANVCTYAIVGLAVETLRRQLNHSK